MDEPDPRVQPLPSCRNVACGQPMGGMRVYKGAGERDRQHLRGAIVQSCTACYWTIFHTQPYNYEDALALLTRLNDPGHVPNNPHRLRPASPGLPVPTATQSNRIDCANLTCLTKQGLRTQGSRTCVEYKCKACCISALTRAAHNGTARQRCNAHSQPENIARVAPLQVAPAPLPQVHGPHAVEGHCLPPRTIEPILLTPLHTHISAQPILDQATPILQPQPHPSLSGLPLQPCPSLRGPSPATVMPSQRAPRKSLAQPLPKEWADTYQAATQERRAIKSLKAQQQEMDDRKRRTCMLIMYHTEGEEALRLDHYVNTFPHLQLKSVPLLAGELNFNEASRLDYWQGEWTTITPETPLYITKGQRVLLRWRPSLLKILKDCPGLDRELDLQVTRRPVNNKRAGLSLVSPAKKVARHEKDESVRMPPTPITSSPRHSLSRSSRSLSPLSPSLPPAPVKFSSKSQQRLEITRPKLKKQWPNDFYTCEIRNGFRKFHEMLKDRNSLEKDAFPKAFRDVKYVKTTVWKYKKVWNEADSSIKDVYINHGYTSAGLFSRFLSALVEDSKHHDDSSSVEPSLSPDPSPTPVNLSKSLLSLTRQAKPTKPLYSLPPPSVQLQPFITRSQTPRAVDADPDADDTGTTSTDSDDPGEFYGHMDNQELCPFCDCPMEAACSPKLLALRAALEDKTWSDPLPDLPNHRSAASFTVYASFCEQHRFESRHLPYAVLKRWPLKINFGELYDRVIAFRTELEDILEEPEESCFFQHSKKLYGPSSSGRADNWNQFTEQSAGYYGEEGYEILTVTLQCMFPENSTDPRLFFPLSWNSFIYEFLLPETAVFLIQDDLKLTRHAAIRTLHKSRVFGTLMHPSNDDSSAVLDIMRRNAQKNNLEKKDLQVKKEDLDIDMSNPKHEHIVIDLTLDD